MNNHLVMRERAMDKVLLCENIIREIKAYVDSINPLLNTCKSQSLNKLCLLNWKLNSEASKKHYEDENFKLKLYSLVIDPLKQIHLDENVKN